MFTKIAFIALTLLTLETCEKQKISAAEKNEALEKTETDLKSGNVDSLKKIDDTLVIFSQEKAGNYVRNAGLGGKTKGDRKYTGRSE